MEFLRRRGIEKEVRKVVIFGSFLTRATPNDLDVAIFQDSDETYLPLGNSGPPYSIRGRNK